jgi:hypothetical protein
MMTPEQRANWFTYHAPTDETRPKYAAIAAAESVAAQCVTALLNGGDFATYDNINAACLRFADVIDENAPDSADKSAAIRCVRLARNALNEAVAVGSRLGWNDATVIALAREAGAELRRARWQANSAIACNGK